MREACERSKLSSGMRKYSTLCYTDAWSDSRLATCSDGMLPCHRCQEAAHEGVPGTIAVHNPRKHQHVAPVTGDLEKVRACEALVGGLGPLGQNPQV